MRPRSLVFILALASCSEGEPGPIAADTGVVVDAANADGTQDAKPADPPRILSAFFGLDDALPAGAALICPSAPGTDGMPVVLSRRVLGNPAPTSFRVKTRSGATHEPKCATLAPAVAPTERHTVLLTGDFGGEPDDPPVLVEIVGSLPLEGGSDAKGLSASVVPLSSGPSVVLAIRYLPSELATSACPVGSKQIIQITFDGGVSAPNGAAVGDAERRRIHVIFARDAAGNEVTPDSLADLGDSDNYLHLCLSTDERPIAVRVEASTFVDPRGDLNAETRVDVTDPD